MLLASNSGGSQSKIYVNDVFSTYLYTGNGSTQTINNGIDLAGKGGLVWVKNRTTSARDHILVDTSRGATNVLYSNATLGQSTVANSVTAFSSSGFSVGALSDLNQSTNSIVSWTFRNADKFYGHSVVTKSAGSNATVSFANLGTLGMVRVKRTDSTGSWYIWHRSLSAGQLLIGETTAAAATLGHITVSGTTVTLVNGVIADGTYLVEGFAHDTSADGIIQCGSFTTDGSGNATVNLGWEPQWLLIKASNGSGSWVIRDTIRGLGANTGAATSKNLYAESSSAEVDGGTVGITATGITISAASTSLTYIYLAIRRPNKPPTSGTEVYNAIARTGTGAAATVTGVGFAPDLVIDKNRGSTYGGAVVDRLRGPSLQLYTEYTGADETPLSGNGLTSLDMDGYTTGSGTGGQWNRSTLTYINWFFRRAPGVFDIVCDTGTGSAHTVAHSLGVAPELIIRKSRSLAEGWPVRCSNLASGDVLFLNTTAASINNAVSFWTSTAPTTTTFSVGTGSSINNNGSTYVTYLFATKAGISKVGSYTGNGSTQTINCGFSTGARFVLIKRTDSTGDWYVWDTARGIVSANDPHLSLNTTAAEVTTDDSIDPDTSGFIVNQVAATNINVNAASYIFLAIA